MRTQCSGELSEWTGHKAASQITGVVFSLSLSGSLPQLSTDFAADGRFSTASLCNAVQLMYSTALWCTNICIEQQYCILYLHIIILLTAFDINLSSQLLLSSIVSASLHLISNSEMVDLASSSLQRQQRLLHISTAYRKCTHNVHYTHGYMYS